MEGNNGRLERDRHLTDTKRKIIIKTRDKARIKEMDEEDRLREGKNKHSGGKNGT